MYSKEARITLFSDDANVEYSGYENRPRTFNWNVSKNLGTFGDNCKIAVESIFCRNMRALLKGSVNSPGVLTFKNLTGGNKDSNYLNNETYKTLALTGSGTGLVIKNSQRWNTVNNIVGAPSKIVERGKGYNVGDTVLVLDGNDAIPEPEASRAILTITQIEPTEYIENHDFITTDLDVVGTEGLSSETFINQQRMLGVGNQDEKELYSIRCPHVNGNYDSRAFNGGDIIYMGAMKMNNTNPEKAFCYDLKDKSFLNGGVFTLSIDSNYGNEKGISHDMIWGITLKVYDYK